MITYHLLLNKTTSESQGRKDTLDLGCIEMLNAKTNATVISSKTPATIFVYSLLHQQLT